MPPYVSFKSSIYCCWWSVMPKHVAFSDLMKSVVCDVSTRTDVSMSQHNDRTAVEFTNLYTECCLWTVLSVSRLF